MAATDPYIGRELEGGKYQILQKIGAGGMGAVYKATQPHMSRMVAIKVLHSKLVGRKDLVSRFSREAKALGHLNHPNTVKVYDDGVLEDGSLYIVMEFLEGKNLNQVVRAQGPMAPDRALPVLIQVCGALEEAHGAGIVHRDLKPENIFLCNQGGLKDFPKVLDFGLAKVTEREMRPGSIILTQEGMVFGTPEFMSPEQAQGKTLDARSDIYSLATILYEVLTGKLPFDAKLPMEYIQLHVMQTPMRIEQRVAGLNFPPGLGDVLAKALSKDPDDRYPSASAFAAALEPFATAKGPFPVYVAPKEPPPAAPAPPAAHRAQAAKPEPATAAESAAGRAPGPPVARGADAVRGGFKVGVGLMIAVALGCLVLGVLVTIVVMRTIGP